MLKRLLDLSSFCKVNERLNNKLKLTEEGWKELQEVVESLAPVRTLTTKLQESVLTSGQTLGHWQLTMLLLEQIYTPLAANANGMHEITYDSTSVGLLAATSLIRSTKCCWQPF